MLFEVNIEINKTLASFFLRLFFFSVGVRLPSSKLAIALVEMSDSEYEEEEALVLVELSGVVQSELTDTDMTKFKLLGIHKDKSVLQVSWAREI